MLLKSRAVPFGACVALGLMLVSCVIEDPREDEREKVEMEKWENTPASSSYSYAKCESDSVMSLLTFCGQKPDAGLTGSQPSPYKYNWNTNCSGGDCATVSVFAHYSLTENLGPGQTLRIEAFDNSQFRGSPVSSLDIVGFDTSKPNSTGREEIYLAPGEYYFRAFITHAGDTPVPYAFQGMELVGDRPVGVLGALSGAERVVINSPSDSEVIHIAIDQLFKKPVAPEDSLAKLRLQISVDPTVTIPRFRDMHVVFMTEPDLEAAAAYDFTLSTNELLVAGSENKADFVSPSLNPGEYYVFTYIDANGNSFADSDEAGSFVLDGTEPAVVKVEKNRTRSAKVQILNLPVVALE